MFECDQCERSTKTKSGLAKHKAYKHPPQREGLVYQAAKSAVEASDHLTALDDPTIETLYHLAKTIDGMDERDPESPMDNVTIPTFLRCADALGFTPQSRKKLDLKPPEKKSQLGELRSKRGLRVVG